MTIVWYGQSFFEIAVKGAENGAVKIAIDPYGPDLGLRVPKVEADIVLVSHQHADHANKDAIKGSPFIIDSPGEYELKNVFIKGISAFHDNTQGKERGRLTMFKIDAEDMTLCHLSDLGQKELTDEQLEAIGEVDVLLAPVGGNFTIDAKGAADVISQIEPRLVIPMHYKIAKLNLKLEGVDKFLKQMGEEGIKPEKKLKLKPRDLPQEETKIVVLEP